MRGQEGGHRARGRESGMVAMDTQQGQNRKRPHTSISPSRWQTMYDKPLPSSLTCLCTPEQCQLCEIPFNGPTISRSHYDGKAHEKKVTLFLTEQITDEVSRPKKVKLSAPTAVQTATGLHCSVCNLICTSTVVYDSHMQGKSHASKVRAANLANMGEMGNKLGCKICNIFVTSQDALTTHLAGKQHRRKSERLVEVEGGLQLVCELCGVTATDKPGLEAHFNGKKHMEKMAGPKVKREKERFCSKCQVMTDTYEAWDLHVEGEAHKLTVAKLGLGPKVIDYNTYEFNSFKGEENEVKEEVMAE